MLNKDSNAGTEVQQRNTDEVTTSSPACCNTIVSGCAVVCSECNGTGLTTQCDHDEIMRQGDGYVYGVCSKCNTELY